MLTVRSARQDAVLLRRMTTTELDGPLVERNKIVLHAMDDNLVTRFYSTAISVFRSLAILINVGEFIAKYSSLKII